MSEHRCSELMFNRNSYRGQTCTRSATVEREGKWYCKQHDPVNVEERRAKRDEKWDAEYKARNSQFIKQNTALKYHEKLVDALRNLLHAYTKISSEKFHESLSDLMCDAGEVLREIDKQTEKRGSSNDT